MSSNINSNTLNNTTGKISISSGYNSQAGTSAIIGSTTLSNPTHTWASPPSLKSTFPDKFKILNESILSFPSVEYKQVDGQFQLINDEFILSVNESFKASYYKCFIMDQTSQLEYLELRLGNSGVMLSNVEILKVQFNPFSSPTIGFATFGSSNMSILIKVKHILIW